MASKQVAEAEGLGAIYRRYWTLVRGCALRIVGDGAAADDVTQEVFMRYWAYREKGGEVAMSASAFLYTSAARCALNHLRGNKRRTHRELKQPEAAPNPATPEDVLTVRWLLGALPEDLAQIAAYHYLEGLEHEEIAQLLGMQRRTVGRRLEAFREQARALLENQKQVIP